MDLDAMRHEAEELSASLRQQGVKRGNFGDLLTFARDAQAQARHQAEAVQHAQQGGGGIGALMSALGMDYDSDYVKRVECPSCGGPKKLPSPSAYVYCDYCSALADFDFRRACADAGSALPGPAYVQLVNGMQAQLKAARQAGDQEAYRQHQRQIFDAYVTACPQALSHRLADPVYRTQLIDFMADTSVANDFDPEFSALEGEMNAKVRGLEWTGSVLARRTGGPSFRALVDICARRASRANQIASTSGLAARDPDHASEAVRTRMHDSLFSQGWLPMLEADDAAWLIDQLGLRGEYSKVEPPADAETRNCGGCGGPLTTLPGARTVVCDHCGRTVDVGGAQSPCGQCGAALSFPVGISRLQCPYCQTEAERVGWT
jgi:LSD1 subclass zinc finger protein